MTQMSEALKGNVTPEMELVAKYEGVNVNKIIRGLSKGTIVIPKNRILVHQVKLKIWTLR